MCQAECFKWNHGIQELKSLLRSLLNINTNFSVTIVDNALRLCMYHLIMKQFQIFFWLINLRLFWDKHYLYDIFIWHIFFSHGQWIIDGLPVRPDVWRSFTENAPELIPDLIVYLQDTSINSEYLLRRWIQLKIEEFSGL